MQIVNTLEFTPLFTAAIALFGVIFTGILGWWNSRRQFKGLVVSQSRINWIQEVRKTAAVFLSHMTNCKSIIEQIEYLNNWIENLRDKIITYEDSFYVKETGETIDYDNDMPGYEESNNTYRKKIANVHIEIKDLTRQLSEEQDKFNENFQLLILYLPKNYNKKPEQDTHAKIQSILYNLRNMINDSIKNKKNVNYNHFTKEVEALTNSISDYLKEEWEVAKKNK